MKYTDSVFWTVVIGPDNEIITVSDNVAKTYGHDTYPGGWTVEDMNYKDHLPLYLEHIAMARAGGSVSHVYSMERDGMPHLVYTEMHLSPSAEPGREGCVISQGIQATHVYDIFMKNNRL